MKSMETELAAYLNRDVTAWLNHHDLKVLTGRLTAVKAEHFVLRSGEHTYLIPYNGLAAIRPAAQ